MEVGVSNIPEFYLGRYWMQPGFQEDYVSMCTSLVTSLDSSCFWLFLKLWPNLVSRDLETEKAPWSDCVKMGAGFR